MNMTKKLKHSFLTAFYAGLICSVIISCDGGIFGTGDGSSDGLIVEGTGSVPSIDGVPQPEATPTEPPLVEQPEESAVNGESTNLVTEFNPETDVTVSFGISTSFSNDSIVSNNPTAQLQFVNLTNTAVGVFSNSDSESDAVVLTSSESSFDEGFVPLNTTALLIDAVNDVGERTSLTSINPVTLANGSRSLIVLRRLEPTVDIIVLPIGSGTVEANQVAVRFISSALIGDPIEPSTFTLQTTPTQSDGLSVTTTTFEPITFANPVTSYRSIPAGIARLNDSAARYVDLTLDLNVPGSIITVILDPSLPNQHLVLIDSP